ELNGGYFSVTVPAGGFAEAKIDNVPKTGKIKILKVDKGTLALLAGAKFELYEVDDIGGKYISGGPSVKLTKVAGQPELLTDENGAALTTALNPTKTYYVRELADSPLIKSGYRMVAEWTGPIQISAPGIALAVVKNYKPAQGSGIKRDQDGAGLEGAVMGIFKSQKDAAAMNSWLRTNTLTEAALTKEFCAAMHIKSTAKSTKNGQFVFTDLVPGETYYIVELVAPQNYVRADVVKQATVAPGGNGFTVAPQFVNEKYGRIALFKQTELSGRRFSVEGAVFRIYKAVGTPTKPHLGNHVCDASCGLTKGELVYEGKTDSAGEILTVLLPSGDYLVEEESAPDNFTKSPDIYHLFVEVNEINSHLFTNPVLNTSGDGRFELTKHSSLDKAPDVTYLAATFKLQVFNGTSYVDYIPAGSSTVYTFTTSPSDKYLSGYLPIGKYKLVETVAPIGYTIGGTLEFEITKGTVTEKLEIKNDPQGKLLVAKYASFDGVRGAVMNNVKFGLFTNEACSGVPKYTALTSNGTATFANIDAGSYWLKELSVGGNAGYVVSDTVTPVTVKIGETVSLSGADAIVNVPVYGKLKIEKTDANDKTAKIKDAVFTIYDNKDCIGKSYGTIRTRADGTGTSGLLNPAKQYWLKETSVPAGYKMVNTGIYGPFTVTANGVNAPGNEQIVITNIKYQKVSLRKVSMLADGTKQPIGEVGFALFEKGADTSNLALAVAVGKTQADGSLTFENLMPNTEYVVRETSVPANHVDNTAALYNVTTSNSGLTEIGEIKNILQGKIELLKFTKWTNAAGATTGEPLQFAKFSIFEKGADTSNPANARDTIVTDSNGFAASKYLDPGEYVVVETSAPTGFVIAGKNAYDITVESGKTNTQLKDNPIENVPQSGRFTVEKYAANTNPAVLLRGAVFELYHRVGGAYELYNAASPTFTVYGTYASGYMPAGEYMIKEIKAPAGCTLDATEHKFTVKVSTTTAVRVSNDLQGAVELKKISDAQNGSEPLAGARFQLWQGAVTTGKKVGGVAETNANGICRFDNLDAGTYYVEEISAPTGFAVNKNISPVTVEKKGEAATYYITVEDKADMGRIIVEKTSEKAPQKGLEGAQFEVWSVGTSTQPSVKIAGPFTTDASGFARTTLLPAQMLGTHYLVKETKAPDGYTLDSRLSKTEKTVKVMPILNPSANAATNFVSFTDMSESDIAPFPGKIVKTIVKTSEEKSLLLSDFEVTYRLDGYADGKNPLPLEGFTVTDNMLAMKHYNASGYALTFKDGDYSIKSVRIYKAKNANGGAVNAVTEYQTYEQLGTDSWTSLPSSYVRENLETLADGGFATVDLSNATNRSVMGVRVRYSGTNKNFTADGIELDVVFAKRASNAMRNEVRRIENTGSLDYTYTIFNSVHAAHAVSVSKPSNLVFSELPPMSADLVPVSLSNIAKNAGKTFVAGAAVEYTVTASNNAQDKKVFRDPIIAIDI
ncbi:MAG: SpaA isopeptide-forming pilin-related protein, partial [Oscillospiraceae bacterium]